MPDFKFELNKKRFFLKPNLQIMYLHSKWKFIIYSTSASRGYPLLLQESDDWYICLLRDPDVLIHCHLIKLINSNSDKGDWPFIAVSLSILEIVHL